MLIKNSDDKDSDSIKFNNILTFGKKGDYSFSNLQVKPGLQQFKVQDINVDLHVPAEFNIYNALASIAVADKLGVNKHQIWNSLNEFKGTWRRFELVGKLKNNLIISDYAHHPESIQGLLRATKDFYPDKKIIAIFQPHHHNRTKTLLKEFAKSFYIADQVIINEIYKVSGREDKEYESVSSLDLVKAMHHNKKYYAPDFKTVREIIKEINPVNTVLVFIGAGDIDNLARDI